MLFVVLHTAWSRFAEWLLGTTAGKTLVELNELALQLLKKRNDLGHEHAEHLCAIVHELERLNEKD